MADHTAVHSSSRSLITHGWYQLTMHGNCNSELKLFATSSYLAVRDRPPPLLHSQVQGALMRCCSISVMHGGIAMSCVASLAAPGAVRGGGAQPIYLPAKLTYSCPPATLPTSCYFALVGGTAGLLRTVCICGYYLLVPRLPACWLLCHCYDIIHHAASPNERCKA